MSLSHKILGLGLALVLNSACGSNAFEEIDNAPAAERAVAAIEKNLSSKAISIILKELGGDFSAVFKAVDVSSAMTSVESSMRSALAVKIASEPKATYNLISILATAVAKKNGIETLTIALKLAEDDTDGANAISALYPITPDASTANIRQVELANSLMNIIDESYLTTEDRFKMALLLSVNTSMVTKSLDTDGDGSISAGEALELGVETATALITLISQADSVLANIDQASSSGDDSNSQASASNISAIQSSIDAQPGATSTDRLRNFLASQ